VTKRVLDVGRFVVQAIDERKVNNVPRRAEKWKLGDAQMSDMVDGPLKALARCFVLERPAIGGARVGVTSDKGCDVAPMEDNDEFFAHGWCGRLTQR